MEGLSRSDQRGHRPDEIMEAMSEQSGAVTRLLKAWDQGDVEARDALIPLVYRQLRRLAVSYLRRERSDHTLQASALEHEAFVALLRQHPSGWQKRDHFFGSAAQMMRRVLVDYARKRQRAKRPGPALRVALNDDVAAVEPPESEVLALDHALEELSRLDPRQ